MQTAQGLQSGGKCTWSTAFHSEIADLESRRFL